MGVQKCRHCGEWLPSQEFPYHCPKCKGTVDGKAATCRHCNKTLPVFRDGKRPQTRATCGSCLMTFVLVIVGINVFIWILSQLK